MKNVNIIQQLHLNKSVIYKGLKDLNKEMYLWKPDPKTWSLLEILCHLYDEECEDFRVRLGLVLENPDQTPPPIDPTGWVKSRKYMEQDFNKKLDDWKNERTKSIEWLQSLGEVNWDNTYHHKALGPFSGYRYLANWLAHDYLHIRQITRTKYHYLKNHAQQDISYAGTW